MEEKKTQSAVASGEEVPQSDIVEQPVRLTPTGKISHAKTRVYTQRYRKQWEEMPDFKGWLTSVPYQPTRAFCTYCKKNLHAHRLSLLKHTCTMKHQRSALMHEGEENVKSRALARTARHEMTETNENAEAEENEDEIEYVVERLDMEDEEGEDSQDKFEEEAIIQEEEEEEEVEEIEGEEEAEGEEENEDVKPVLKRIKIEDTQQKDTLAQAMAHVHGEYLEEVEEQENVHMEMVVESEDQNSQEVQMVSVIGDSKEAGKEVIKDTNRKAPIEEKNTDRKSGNNKGEKVIQSKEGVVVACPLSVVGTTYQINTSTSSGSGAIGVLQPVTTIPIVSTQNKTITLTTGGKTVTLTGGTFTPGAKYVLNKVKGKLSTIMMADKKATVINNQAGETAKSATTAKSMEQVVTVAGTSQQPTRKLLLKPVKPLNVKKPRISTHVMDSTKGLPVGGLQVSLYKLMDGRWTFLNESNTAPNGRCTDLVDNNKINFTAGRYKMHFDVDKYFTLRRIETMYPFIEIVFDVKNPSGNYHIPVLLSPYGYTTYRGSER